MGCCQSDSSSDRQPLMTERRSGAGGGGGAGSTDEFSRPYIFKAKNTVIIRHSGGSSIRVHDSDDKLLPNGAKKKFARFEAEPEGANKVKFKSLHTGKYIRIQNNNEVDCGGKGGKQCLFKVHHEQEKGHVKLEAVHC